MFCPFLYHATRGANWPSIQKHGLLTRFWGSIHGKMDYYPPIPVIYMARGRNSNNLHASLFDDGPVIVVKIDRSLLDEDEFYPDDALGYAFAEGAALTTRAEIARAYGVPIKAAVAMMETLEAVTDEKLMQTLKPTWAWYLRSRMGGEISYSKDIPAKAIVDVKELSR